jgi:ferredoxin
MKVIVNRDVCEANAICVGLCPQVFRLEEDDTLTILMQEVPEHLRPVMEDAVARCPRQALRIEG